MNHTSPIRLCLALTVALTLFCQNALVAKANPAYQLRYGDTLNVTVLGHPELSVQDQPVRPDGALSLPLIHEVKVEDETVTELTHVLAQSYLPYLTHPEVVVNVAKFRPLHVTVIGQVNHPGTFDFNEPPSLVEAIASAGGLTLRGSHSAIQMVPPKGTRTTYDLDRVLDGKQTPPRMTEGTIVEVGEVWGPDWDRIIPLVASMLTAYAFLVHR